MPSLSFSSTASLWLTLTLTLALALCLPGPWGSSLLGLQAVEAVALTTYLTGGEKSCFYADVDSLGEKVGFYFAIQSGGDFSTDYYVLDPEERTILEGKEERQGDYIFTANRIGEYTFCFQNDDSMTPKLLDFDIMVETEPRRTLSTQQIQSIAEHTSKLEESIFKIRGLVFKIIRILKHFHTRHHRNHSTVLSTQSRLFWYSILESVAIVAMSFAQIWVLKTFFKGGSKICSAHARIAGWCRCADRFEK